MGFSYVDVDSLEGEGPGGMVVKGRGTMRIDGEEVELRPGRFVHVDANSTRMPIAGGEGLEFVTFGAPLEGRYEPPDWG